MAQQPCPYLTSSSEKNLKSTTAQPGIPHQPAYEVQGAQSFAHSTLCTKIAISALGLGAIHQASKQCPHKTKLHQMTFETLFFPADTQVVEVMLKCSDNG